MNSPLGSTRICGWSTARKFVHSLAGNNLFQAVMLPIAAAAGLLAFVPVASATDWYVANSGSDANSCTASLMPCQTIQAAINKASPGDTIHVGPGIYPEPAPGPLTVTKKLRLLGSQAGSDARARVGAESVVTDPQGTSVSASDVYIDGFTFQDSVFTTFTGFGIWLNPGSSGTVISNNIIQNNIVGIGLANNGAQAIIAHNLIQFNNLPGGASGNGIYTDEFVGGPVVRNVLVTENAFVGNDDAGLDISNTDPAGGAFNLDISSNSFDSDGRAVVLFNTHNSKFQNNTVPDTTFVGSAAVRLFDNNSNLLIIDNDLISGVGHAIRLSFIGAVGNPSSGVAIHYNNIGTAGAASFTLDGLLVDPGSHVGTVNAECNWWGSPTGPFNPANPSGLGEEVVGDADFTPWLTAPTPVGACQGGAPSTPGKVTGGGQIPGEDPVFSPFGELLSLPALIPSLTSPTGKATFGLTVSCCPVKGNLEYNDHENDVRIKAQSIDTMVIGAGPCGPNTHATFTGTASVIRSTGTTTEPFTVDVDDCGEPGSADTFGIKTTTYSNGPSKLIGGNIQIHR
jgi:hypothetical protein